MSNLSQKIHDWIYKDCSQALCSRAWAEQDNNLFWWLWTYVFGRKHCYRSYLRWRKRK